MLPPPPNIPAILQTFLTQIYSTGDILDQMYQNPLIAIPVIARTICHEVAQSKIAEQRSAAVWRTLYPDAYYRSIDHANVCLALYDKKQMQSKHILLDLQRRIEDCEQGMNPQYIDSMIDFCAPRIFDAVTFRKYLGQQELTTKYLVNYFNRLQVYQNFVPESNILMPFRLNCAAVNKIM